MLDTQAEVVLHQVLEHEEGGAFGLVFRQNAYQQGLGGVTAPGREGRQEVNPAERENTALGLAHGSGNMRHGNGEAY